MRDAVHPDALTIFGATFDETMDDEIRVTVIATGFDEKKGLDSVTASASQSGGSPRSKFEELFQTQSEEKKTDEEDPFDSIMRIFNNQ